MFAPLRWFIRNFSTLILSFILAVVVWVSAVITVDPNIENRLERPVPIELVGNDPGLRIMNEFPETVTLTLIAPQSVWTDLNSDPSTIRATVDLNGVPEGEYTLPVKIDIEPKLADLISQDPREITIRREKIVTQSFPVEIKVNGSPPLGYQIDPVIQEPAEVIISGPESQVLRVQSIIGQIDISGLTETVTRFVGISALDADGRVISGLNITPNSVSVTAPVRLLGGYRNVIVKVVTTGIVASGYRLTNYLPSPTSVVVFSTDPRKVELLPGYIQTKPLDLSGADDDFETLLELDLPDGIVAATDSKVLVQVSIAAIETSLTISLPIEVTGLLPGLEASISPGTVDIILSGPVPVLNDLKPSDIRVIVDLENYQEGIHQLIPVIDFVPAEVEKVSILPATVEVTIMVSPTPTPTRFSFQADEANPTLTATVTPTLNANP